MKRTFTFCVDTRDTSWKPGKHVNRLWTGAPLRSIRFWWLWFAIAAYRLDDREVVREPHAWSD